MKNRKHICIFAILVLWFLNCLAILQAHEYRLIYHEEFNKSEFVETRHLQLPKNWYLQNTKKWGNNVITKKREDGFFVHSPYQKIDLHGEKFEVFGENLRVEIVIRNMDTDKSQADVEIGICDYGLLNPGYHVLIQTKLSSNEEKTLSFDSSVFQNYCSIQPVISVHGSVIIKSLKFFTQKADDVRILEGTILERSALLNPKKSDYPDCRFTAHFKGYSLLQGDNLHRDI